MPCLQHNAEHPTGFPLTEEGLRRLCSMYMAEFPTEADCLEDFVRTFEEAELIQCKRGHKAMLKRKRGARVGKCTCGEKVHVTAGTFLRGAKKLRAWHFALWIRGQGVSLNSIDFAKLAKIAQSSSWEMLKKIAVVLEKELPEDFWTIYSGVFLDLFFRRSTETPAREHPQSEQIVAEREASLSVETLVFEKHPVIHNQLRRSEEQTPLIDGAKKFIRFVFGGVSRKHLQSYLAVFWFYADRERWGKQSLLKTCLQHGPIEEKMLHKVTPLMVSLMPIQAH